MEKAKIDDIVETLKIFPRLDVKVELYVENDDDKEEDDEIMVVEEDEGTDDKPVDKELHEGDQVTMKVVINRL